MFFDAGLPTSIKAFYTYGSTTGDSITLSGVNTLDSYVLALSKLRFKNNSNDPTNNDTKLSRTIEFTIRDNNSDNVENQWSTVITRKLNIVAVLDLPKLADSRTNKDSTALQFTENGAAITIGDSLTITDVDDTNIDSVIIRISKNYDYIINSPSTGNAINLGDSLFFDAGLPTSIKAFYTYGSTTGDSITLSGVNTLDSYVLALSKLRFKNNSNDPTNNDTKLSRTIEFTIRDNNSDNVENQWSTVITRKLNIVAVLDLPKLADSRTDKDSTALQFTENGAAITIGDSLTITDVDDTNIDSVIIRISKNYDYIINSPSTGNAINLGDSLFFDAGLPTSIKAFYTYGSTTGDSITLSGVNTLDSYVLALSKLRFKNNSNDPTNNDTKLSRTIEFTIRDNNSDNVENQWSTVITRKLNIVAVLDLPKLADSRTDKDSTALQFTENDSAILIGDSLTITDVDDTNIDSVIIRISKNYDYIINSPSTGNAINLGDSLFFDAGLPTSIKAFYTYGSTTGDSITLSGVNTLDSYVLALSKLRFKNNSNDPTNNDTKLSRTIEFTIRDNNSDNVENQWSTVITRKLNIVAVLDLPKLADSRTDKDSTALQFTENDSAILIGDSLTITDVDDTNIDSVIIRISKNYDYIINSPSTGNAINLGDSLFFDAGLPTSIKAFYTYGSTTGDSITLSGVNTLDSYVLALSKLRFKNNSNDPTNNDTKLSRTIEFTIRDNNSDNVENQWSTVITRKLNIVAVLDLPKLADSRTDKDSTALQFTENGAAITIGDSLTITDVDDTNIDSVIIRISKNYDYIINSPSTGNAINLGDSLFFDAGLPTSIKAFYTYGSTTGDSITLSGVNTLDSYVLALSKLRFKNNSNDPTNNDTKLSRTIEFTIRDNNSDNVENQWSTVITRKLNIVPTADIAKLSDTRTLEYRYTTGIKAAGIVFGDSLTITDTDDTNLDSVIVRIDSYFFAGDSMFFSAASKKVLTTNSIVSSFGGGSTDSILTLSGSANIDSYLLALGGLTFKHTTVDVSDQNTKTTRIISIKVRDADSDKISTRAGFSNVITKKIIMDSTLLNLKPVVTGRITRPQFIENTAGVFIDDSIVITDDDNTNIDSVTITIGSYLTGDSLFFTATGNTLITTNSVNKHWTYGNNNMKLGVSKTKAIYQSILRELKFKHIGDNPSGSGSNLTRTISYVVQDTGNYGVVSQSNAYTVTIDVIPLLDLPKLGGAANTKAFTERDSTMLYTGLTITDADDDIKLDSAIITIDSYFFAGDSIVLTVNGKKIAEDSSILFTKTNDSTITLGANQRTLRAYRDILREIKFMSASYDPTDSTNKPKRIISLKIRDVSTDSVAFKLSNAFVTTLNITAINRAPVLTDTRINKDSTTIKFTEMGAAVNIGDSFTLTDLDADTNVDSLVIRISGNAMATDSLFFTNTGTMTSSYNYGANTGDSITLGTGSIKFDSMVVLLKNLRFKNTGTNPTDTDGTKKSRTITFKVRDVSTEDLTQLFSNVVTRKIFIVGARTAATIADERTNQANNAITFTENGDSVVIGDSITITDTDGTQLDSAVIRISRITLQVIV